MFDYISKTFYGAAMNGAKTGRINPAQAHKLTGMVRLAMACNYLRGMSMSMDTLAMRLTQSALQQWKDRYACKPDADFDKAVRVLARYIRRHA